ncbi:MAG: thioredoxin domain-containing protein [Anaerolineales bacterium]|jgi:protein-disulfide isomerase
MNEPQIVQEDKGTNSNTKWILLIVGGGCVLLVCVCLVIALAVAFFFPVTGNVFSEINEESGVPQPADEVYVTPQDLGTILIPEKKNYPLVDDNKMGNPDAPVKIVIYSDFQCVYCRNYWNETEPLIIENYVETGQVYYEYRSFGDFLGSQSATAAEAAYCAGDQGQFWPYHEILFLNWTGEGSGDFSFARQLGYAEALDLDVKTFSTCLEGGKYQYQIEEDLTNARTDDIRATPSFMINGELVEGALPYSEFEEVIEAALSNE